MFSFVPHFLIGLFGSLKTNFLSSLYTLDINTLSDGGLLKIFSQFAGGNSVLLTVPFCLTESLQFYEVTFVDSMCPHKTAKIL